MGLDLIAATKIKNKFNRQGSSNTHRMPDLMNSDGENGNVFPDENTHLLSRITTTSSGTPYYKHENPLIRWPFLVLHITWALLRTNYVNILLIFVPLGIIAGALHWNQSVVFTLNFLAIIPLAALLAFATEELAVPLGQTIGGLMNATFGNAVELIVRPFFLPQGRKARTPPRHVSCANMKAPGEHHRPAQ